MPIKPVLNQILILFILLFVGFVVRKRRMLHGDINHQLSDLMLTVFLPCAIVSSFLHNDIRSVLAIGSRIFAIAFCTHLGSIAIGFLAFRKLEAEEKRIMWFVTVFSNSAFMGYPIMESMYGKIGVMYGAFYNVAFSLFLWTFGYGIFAGAKDVKIVRNVFKSPGILSLLAGTAISYLPIELPSALTRSIDLLGGMTTPLCMIVIGSTLAEIKLKDVFSGVHIYIGSAMRLLGLPLAALFALRLLGVDGPVLGISVIAVAMPVGTSAVLFARKFGGDVHLATRCVFFSTAASLATIPAILFFLG